MTLHHVKLHKIYVYVYVYVYVYIYRVSVKKGWSRG